MDFENLVIPPELAEKVTACETPEEVLAPAKRKGYKLTDEDLAAVTGGWGVKDVLTQLWQGGRPPVSRVRRLAPSCQKRRLPVRAAKGTPPEA